MSKKNNVGNTDIVKVGSTDIVEAGSTEVVEAGSTDVVNVSGTVMNMKVIISEEEKKRRENRERRKHRINKTAFIVFTTIIAVLGAYVLAFIVVTSSVGYNMRKMYEEIADRKQEISILEEEFTPELLDEILNMSEQPISELVDEKYEGVLEYEKLVTIEKYILSEYELDKYKFPVDSPTIEWLMHVIEKYETQCDIVYYLVLGREAINDLYDRLIGDTYSVEEKAPVDRVVYELRDVVDKIVYDNELRELLHAEADQVFRIVETLYNDAIMDDVKYRANLASLTGYAEDEIANLYDATDEDDIVTMMLFASAKNFDIVAKKSYLTSDEDSLVKEMELLEKIEKTATRINNMTPDFLMDHEDVQDYISNSMHRCQDKFLLEPTEEDMRYVKEALDSDTWMWNIIAGNIVDITGHGRIYLVDYDTETEYFVDVLSADMIVEDRAKVLSWTVANRMFWWYIAYMCGELEDAYVGSLIGVPDINALDPTLRDAYSCLGYAYASQVMLTLNNIISAE